MATLDSGKLNRLLRLAQKFNSFYVNGECACEGRVLQQ